MNNQEIKMMARSKRIPLWKIADEYGVNEYTMIHWLRRPLPEEKYKRVMECISKIEEREALDAAKGAENDG